MAGNSQQISEFKWVQNYVDINDSTRATCNIRCINIFDYNDGKFKFYN